MIPEAKAIKLIKIYFYVCEQYDIELKHFCERFSNNNQPEFTDQEIMTIYLYTIDQEQRFKVKQIHQFAHDYLRSWFPKLGTYASFTNRLNRLHEAFRQFVATLLEKYQPGDCLLDQSLLDSMPIITCSGKRYPKVATEIVDKGVCPGKGFYYHGLKLHALAFRRQGRLPFPEQLLTAPASVHDLTLFKTAWSGLTQRCFWGDKIYRDNQFFEPLRQENQSIMLTPVVGVKGQDEREKQFNKAADDLFSRAVSKIRQPIEAFFNWLIQKTDFQIASKVRSTNGLMIHVFGKIAAAHIYLIF